jgi:uncharacterized protein (DUF1501 family)
MLTRRTFLTGALKGASLVAAAPLVPGFLMRTARAAEAGGDNILVVVEMTGGNDGLNTVIPYKDDGYHRARPTLGFKQAQVVRVNDEIGLHPAMKGMERLLQKGWLSVVQGVGYPNPDRSHFESMDRWQSGQANINPKPTAGWLARSVVGLQAGKGGVPLLHFGAEKLPLALTGAPSGVCSVSDPTAFRLNLGSGTAGHQRARKQLLADVTGEASESGGALLPFVQRRSTETYAALDKLEEVLQTARADNIAAAGLARKMELIARLIERGFGTRVFYVALDGFDTHSGQAETHQRLLQELGDAVAMLFDRLERTGDAKRVLVMTYSEFGRRVQENASRGTDHGAGSCLFVAGPAVKGGAVGDHPSLTDLDSGDLKHHTDFRRVYATLLDRWLACESKGVLGEKFEPLELLRG